MPKVVKLALIGNCSFQALLDDRARVRWLCWPRFDSSFVFGGLLDEQHGGEFSVLPAEEQFESRQEYVPNTNILRTVFTSASGSFELIDFAPRFLQYERSFKPTMMMRRLRPISGDPAVRVRIDPRYDYGRTVPGKYTASNHVTWKIDGTSMRLTTNVPLTYVTESRPFLLESDAYLALAWGAPLEASLGETLESFLARTRRYWQRWVKHTALPGVFQREVIRSALALKLHQFEDTGAITAATTTSLPEEHGAGRNWDYRFCWLRDSYFTLKAMRRLGQFEEMEGFVSFLKNLVENAGDRLQPVFGISGESAIQELEFTHLRGYMGNQPVRAGNDAYRQIQNDAYGEMLGAMAPLLLDIRFESELNRRTDRLVWRLLQRIEQTLEEPDAGIWEYRGRAQVHTFSLLMHWTGARIAETIGIQIHDEAMRERARELRLRASTLLEDCFVESKGYYGDSTTSENADASLFMMINLGYLRPGTARAESHLRGLAAELKVSDALLHRYKHEDDFGHSKSTFTVCGFWYAEALARLGHREEARAAVEMLTGYANHVGLFSEDLDPSTGEQLGNFPQTYSHVGLINAAFAINAESEETVHD